jgi:hypothetical protein
MSTYLTPKNNIRIYLFLKFVFKILVYFSGKKAYVSRLSILKYDFYVIDSIICRLSLSDCVAIIFSSSISSITARLTVDNDNVEKYGSLVIDAIVTSLVTVI